MSTRLTLCAVLCTLTACAHAPQAPLVPQAPPLDTAEVARRLPAKVKDREGWAEDILAAIRLTQKQPSAERVCAVIAVIEQESSFQADPAVAELPRIVREGLERKLAPLGPLAGPALDAILDGKAPGSEVSFRARIAKLKTEGDLDRLFRDIAARYRSELPGTFALASAIALVLGKGALEDLNPVTTAGSMQVKVSFARDLGQGGGLRDEDVRELLYTRGGGVRFGTARLIGYPASYDDVIYRFADYNAGVYASRNAAFQWMLAEVIGQPLVTDGDLLAYDDDGDIKDIETNSLRAMLAFGAAHDLSGWAVKRDARKEKSADFEGTPIWRAVRAAWQAKTQQAPAYARLPDVALSSPKLSRPRTTAWFATSVNKRYQRCRAAP